MLTFMRSLIVGRRKARERAEKAARGPAEEISIVLSNANNAIKLQSGVTEYYRRELEARDEVISDMSAAKASQDIESKAAQRREDVLLRRVGELTMENEALWARLTAKEGGA